MHRLLAGALLIGSAAACAHAGATAPTPPSAAKPLPSIASKTQGFERMDGFLPLYWDEAEGKLWMEVPETGTELLYVEGLTAGVGSNDIGLDRNQLGRTRVIRFDRIGRKLLVVEPNYDYRAGTQNAAERRAVDDAFARSVLWGFPIAAETEGRLLVDATDFLIRDVHGVARQLKQTKQGSYKLDKSRSAVDLSRTRAFPRNSEVEVILTFEGEPEGGWIRSVTPSPEAVTVRERHSFVHSPPPGYEPRRFDPRAGYFDVAWKDYAVPLGEPLEQRFITRHRLQKKDPGAAMSDPVEPIVYYVDPGVPEPIRSALVEGAGWWNQAFEAAGYRNAFQVKVLPDTADPMDVRYNMINWVHRSTRGWSYGSSVADPRTGEIIKGHVLLGSLRARQDYLLAEGLLSPYDSTGEVPSAMRELALARIRQLSAHEVGHTLGLAHNYLASSEGRTSVMDYPHPLVKLTADGSIDLSDAYDTGIGEWDKVSIAYGYSDFADGADEAKALERIIRAAREDGLLYLTDQDARPAGSAHPQTHLWDNGVDAAQELRRMLTVRKAALDRFGERAIRMGMPLATMEEALVPLYLHHRYQVEAATKVIGGQYYTYAIRGDGQVPVRSVPAEQQSAALDAVLETLSPSVLALPTELLKRIPPRPAGFPSHRELFDRYTGITFDAVSPAAAAADLTLSFLLQEERAARLVEQHALDPSLPGFQDVLERLEQGSFGAAAANPYEAEIKRVVEEAMVERLMGLAASAPMPQVRSASELELRRLRDRLQAAARGASDEDRATDLRLASDIQRFLDRPAGPWSPAGPLPAPPGSPIGGGGDFIQPWNGTP